MIRYASITMCDREEHTFRQSVSLCERVIHQNLAWFLFYINRRREKQFNVSTH